MKAPRFISVKGMAIALLVVCETSAMAPWFSASAIVPFLRGTRALSGFEVALLTSGAQAGFAIGTFISALLGLPDRIDPRRFFMIAALGAAAATALVSLVGPSSNWIVALRIATGVFLAGVYPIGMKIAATWAKADLGLLVGVLTGALTLGVALPHLFNAFGGLDWRVTLLGSAACAAAAAFLINVVRLGPNTTSMAPFDWRAALEPAWNRALLLADLSYLGHIWEVCAMWAWIGAFLGASYSVRTPEANHGEQAELIAFASIAAGALGCTFAGAVADRLGRTIVMIGSMLISGTCAVLSGALFGGPTVPLILVCLVWGLSVVPDAAQCSASVAELCDRDRIGTALTVQTCLGFLLTLVPIHLMPILVHFIGWQFAFASLALGPALGIWATVRLRHLPAATRLASGHR